jgi:hypothetical protein
VMAVVKCLREMWVRWSEEGRDTDLAFCGSGHMCEIWGYHGCVAEDIIRLECEAELLGEYFATFRKILHFQVRAVHLQFHISLDSVKAVNFVISYTSSSPPPTQKGCAHS